MEQTATPTQDLCLQIVDPGDDWFTTEPGEIEPARPGFGSTQRLVPPKTLGEAIDRYVDEHPCALEEMAAELFRKTDLATYKFMYEVMEERAKSGPRTLDPTAIFPHLLWNKLNSDERAIAEAIFQKIDPAGQA